MHASSKFSEELVSPREREARVSNLASLFNYNYFYFGNLSFPELFHIGDAL
jgi:hypothetical protein